MSVALSTQQQQFIVLFISDGFYDLMSTCAATGVLPSTARAWFSDKSFCAEIRRQEHKQLKMLGYGPLRAFRDILAIAHSDITQVQAIDGDISNLPPLVKTAIKKIKFKTAVNSRGELITYPAEVEMHDKAWALKQVAEYYDIAGSPEVEEAKTTDNTGPKRIAGLIVRPPLSDDEKELEDLLK